MYILKQAFERLRISAHATKTYSLGSDSVYATISFTMPPHRHTAESETKTYYGDCALSKEEAIELAASKVITDLIESGVIVVKDANYHQLVVVSRKLLYEKSWKLITEPNMPLKTSANSPLLIDQDPKTNVEHAEEGITLTASASEDHGSTSGKNTPGPTDNHMKFARTYSRNGINVRRSLFNTP